jgi:hypothetical protein
MDTDQACPLMVDQCNNPSTVLRESKHGQKSINQHGPYWTASGAKYGDRAVRSIMEDGRCELP